MVEAISQKIFSLTKSCPHLQSLKTLIKALQDAASDQNKKRLLNEIEAGEDNRINEEENEEEDDGENAHQEDDDNGTRLSSNSASKALNQADRIEPIYRYQSS